MTNLLEYLSPRLEPEEVIERLTVLPPVPNIEGKTKSQRLACLQTIYRTFIPMPAAVETYYKLYEALSRALQKKMLATVEKQHVENYKGINGGEFSGIIGGADSISVIGESGTGKTATISRVTSLLTTDEVISFKKPYKATIIPCLIVNCPFDSSVKTLLVEIMRLVDSKIGTNYYAGTVRTTVTTGMLMASVSSILMNHVGLLVIDEMQNVIKTKNGFNLVGSLTQLVNSCGVSVVMVANPEVKPFFEQDLKLARRAIGLEFKPMPCDASFAEFVRTLFSYQVTANRAELTDEILMRIYEGTNGIPALVVSLLHDAQERAVIDGSEALTTKAIEGVLSERYGIIMPSLEKPLRKAPRAPGEHIEIVSDTSLEVIEDDFIEKAIKYAKKNGADIVECLKAQVEVVEL